MDEVEWLQWDDPEWLLFHFGNGISERKLRLFAVACCRRIWHLMPDERIRKAVDAAERLADGAITTKGIARVRTPARNALHDASFAVYQAEPTDGFYTPEYLERVARTQAAEAVEFGIYERCRGGSENRRSSSSHSATGRMP
jgi:hypothetical protein